MHCWRPSIYLAILDMGSVASLFIVTFSNIMWRLNGSNICMNFTNKFFLFQSKVQINVVDVVEIYQDIFHENLMRLI